MITYSNNSMEDTEIRESLQTFDIDDLVSKQLSEGVFSGIGFGKSADMLELDYMSIAKWYSKEGQAYYKYLCGLCHTGYVHQRNLCLHENQLIKVDNPKFYTWYIPKYGIESVTAYLLDKVNHVDKINSKYKSIEDIAIIHGAVSSKLLKLLQS